MDNPIPRDTKRQIDRYVESGEPKGHFLKAFLCKDLSAIGLADEHNRAALWAIWVYCYNEIPADCWGSEEIYNAWIKMHREAREGRADEI